jgi:hypothetical protein
VIEDKPTPDAAYTLLMNLRSEKALRLIADVKGYLIYRMG